MALFSVTGKCIRYGGDEIDKPIWEVFDEIVKDVPREELDKLPADLAEQHDHYIYGTPKKSKEELA